MRFVTVASKNLAGVDPVRVDFASSHLEPGAIGEMMLSIVGSKSGGVELEPARRTTGLILRSRYVAGLIVSAKAATTRVSAARMKTRNRTPAP